MVSGWEHTDIPDQHGRRILITGANSGIGLVAARRLAEHGAQVTLAIRSPERGEAALAQIRREVTGADVSTLPLDLADLSSVRRLADSWDGPLDVLINNAGVMAVPRALSADGFELQLATNHLGHFALTGLLLPALLAAPAARVVTLSSLAALGGRIDFDDLDGARRYTPWRAYMQSKLANQLFTVELDRRLRATGAPLLAAACHPGYAATNLQATSAGSKRGLRRRLETAMTAVGNRVVAQPAEAGALPTLYAATSPEVTGGGFYGPQSLFATRGRPGPVPLAPRARDTAAARRLWEVSEQRTGVRFEAPAAR